MVVLLIPQIKVLNSSLIITLAIHESATVATTKTRYDWKIFGPLFELPTNTTRE